MKAILLLTLFVVCLSAEELRLLQFNETYTEWVPFSVVEKLTCIPEVPLLYNFDDV